MELQNFAWYPINTANPHVLLETLDYIDTEGWLTRDVSQDCKVATEEKGMVPDKYFH